MFIVSVQGKTGNVRAIPSIIRIVWVIGNEAMISFLKAIELVMSVLDILNLLCCAPIKTIPIVGIICHFDLDVIKNIMGLTFKPWTVDTNGVLKSV